MSSEPMPPETERSTYSSGHHHGPDDSCCDCTGHEASDMAVVAEQLHTLRDYLRWSLSEMHRHGVYTGHGTDSLWDEAVALVFSAVNLPPSGDERLLDTVLLEDEKQRICEWVRLRCVERKPLPYITGESWFMGLPFEVNEQVLIPRSPIAELIENGFSPWMDPDQTGRILDLCTGSGCIAIACAKVFPEARVCATDISEAALQIADRNLERHQVASRVRLLKGDLFAGVAGEFDVIVSNPPYVDAEDMAALPEEYRAEPELALAAGEDGLDIVRRILAEAANYLAPGGILVVEVGNSAPALEAAYPDVPFMWVEFANGGDGVFVFTREELVRYF